MNESQRTKIQEALEKKGALLPCARCGHRQFSIIDSYAAVHQQEDFHSIQIGGRMIPCAIIGCNNCGHISLHALSPLGLFAAVSHQTPAEPQ